MPRIEKNFQFLSPLISHLHKQAGTGKKIALDIGSGARPVINSRLKYGWILEVVEKDKNKAELITKDFSQYKNLKVINQDICDYNLEFNKYSFINATNVFHFIHKNKYPELFKNISNALEPGGVFVFSIITPDSPNKPQNFINGLNLNEVNHFIINLKFKKKEIIETPTGQYVLVAVTQKPFTFIGKLIKKLKNLFYTKIFLSL